MKRTNKSGRGSSFSLSRIRDNEEGASLLEFTIIATLLLTLLFGIIEFGFAFRDRLTIANATQSAARVGASMGSDPQADISILRSLEQSLSTLPNSGVGIVRYVDIFKAQSDGTPASNCSGSFCTRYAYVPGWTPTCDWKPCPENPAEVQWTGRDDALPDLDVLGLRLGYAHTWLTDFLPLQDVSCITPGVNCWTNTAIMRIEPQIFESP
ncbi:MAG: pilus assembly protein [Acidimicrobiia bacterium]|nr:pilus assembly protein [Acidimicrobiia bacterium]